MRAGAWVVHSSSTLYESPCPRLCRKVYMFYWILRPLARGCLVYIIFVLCDASRSFLRHTAHCSKEARAAIQIY